MQKQSQPLRGAPSAIIAVALAAAFLGACSTPSGGGSAPLDAPATIANAQSAMGGKQLTSLAYTASGTGGIFGQAYVPGAAWPKVNYSNFSRQHDYRHAAMRQDIAISRAEPNGGGAVPLMGMGEQRAVAMLQGGHAWNMLGPAPVASPVALDQRVHDLWTSPHGVLQAALQNQATASRQMLDGQATTAISFSQSGRFVATAYLDAQGLVARVDSRVPNAVMGDTEVVTRYSDYRDHAGVKFPSRIRQSQGGFDTLDLQVSQVQVNPTVDIAVPALVSAAQERAVAQQAAQGVWFIAGGSHNSVAIEMKDHTMLVESPLYDGRAAAVLAEVKRVIPGKPIRYVVSSHHHFDHAGGLRAAVADGATVVASANAKAFYERVLANPSRIAPDALAKSGAQVKVEGVDGKRIFTDGVRSVEISQITGGVHANGFLMVYLPAEKLLIEADAYTPLAPNAAPPAVPNGNNVNLIANIESGKLAVERILPLHGRIVPLQELYTTAGRKL